MVNLLDSYENPTTVVVKDKDGAEILEIWLKFSIAQGDMDKPAKFVVSS